MSGYVYLIGSLKFRWYKIGKSKTPEVRIDNLGILLPFKIKVLGVWKAENHTLLENTLHEKYITQRINGEWFGLTKGEVEQLYQSIPREYCVFWHLNQNNKDHTLATFSNVRKDIIVKNKKPKFTLSDEERNYRRLLSIQEQQMKKIMKEAQLSFDFS